MQAPGLAGVCRGSHADAGCGAGTRGGTRHCVRGRVLHAADEAAGCGAGRRHRSLKADDRSVRRQEEMLDLGVEYLCGDACLLPATGEYDLAVAAYLLNYAHNRRELQSMCDAIAGILKPGGRFITVNSNPACHFPTAPTYRKYGFDTEEIGTWKEGCPVRWTFYLDDGPFDIENYWLDTAIHEEALKRAGFRDVRWHRPQVSSEGVKDKGREYWGDLLEHPPITFLECTR